MFRFTIRDVLWLTVVVALAVVAWQVESSRRAAERDNARLLRGSDKTQVLFGTTFALVSSPCVGSHTEKDHGQSADAGRVF